MRRRLNLFNRADVCDMSSVRKPLMFARPGIMVRPSGKLSLQINSMSSEVNFDGVALLQNCSGVATPLTYLFEARRPNEAVYAPATQAALASEGRPRHDKNRLETAMTPPCSASIEAVTRFEDDDAPQRSVGGHR
ncbi:hypothetical protein [Krasilnikovia sp. M28-CT-15]|uniref:hypothetical protein n=1 Tax=Krasilnikovia sp. M28-CT-15 TaxID=3373540 RepID=UPI00387719C2